MTQDQPDRTIGGLQRRGAATDLSACGASTVRPRPQTTPAEPDPDPQIAPETTSEPATGVTPARQESSERRRQPATRRSPGEGAAEAKDRVTIYLDARARGEARAAYRATAHLEGDRSWSEFVARAIAAEVERRQVLHNGGQPYGHDASPLSPGRPMLE